MRESENLFIVGMAIMGVLVWGAILMSVCPALGEILSGFGADEPAISSGPEVPEVSYVADASPTPVCDDGHDLAWGEVQKEYPYVLWGRTGSVDIKLYEGVNEHLSSNHPRFYGDEQEYYLEYIDEGLQREYLLNLVDKIRSSSTDSDAQARIAISFVQNIPYDYSRGLIGVGSMRYPYEVLYDDKGVCSEKSILAAFILRELGYGVALLEFSAERHMVLGVRAPAEYTYKDTGYAFVEVTGPAIITDSDGKYMLIGKLTTDPIVYPVSEGKAMKNLQGDKHDAREYRALLSKGMYLDPPDYRRWEEISKKYGMRTSSE